MKKDLIKLSLLILGTAGVIIFAPRNKQHLRNIKEKARLVKDRVKIEPEKLNFC